MASGSSEDFQTVITSGWHLRTVDSFELAALTILFYDFFLTFSDEVQHIWKKKISPLSVLYLLNRYFTPIGFVFCIYALFAASWTYDRSVTSTPPITLHNSPQRCQQFAKFEGIVTLITVMVAESMLIIRVHAVFHKNWAVTGGLLFVWLAQLAMMSYVLANSGPVILPSGPITHGCILVGDPKLGSVIILFTVPSLIFDAIVMLLLSIGLYRSAYNSDRSIAVAKLILRDGILYFTVVFLSNLTWVTTGIILPYDLKNIMALFSTAITNILIGRLTLNLKMRPPTPSYFPGDYPRLVGAHEF